MEVNEVFIHLTSLTKPHNLNHLWLAPFGLQSEIIKAIRNEAKHRPRRAGRAHHRQGQCAGRRIA